MLSGASWSVAHPIIVRFAIGPSSCGQTGALLVPDRSPLLALAVALLALMTGASSLGAQQNGTGPASFGNSLPAANRPSAGLSFTNEPYCGLPKTALVAAANRPQPAGTRRMVERLARIRAAADPRQIPFLNDGLADILLTNPPVTINRDEQLQLRMMIGTQLLQAGRTEAALKEFEGTEKFLDEKKLTIGPRGRAILRMRKAITYLRLGEQENCQINHTAESCLFPLQQAGFHQLTRGSRGAVPILQEQLRTFPRDLSARWLLNIAHMTLGEYPGKVDAAALIPPAAFASGYELPRFPEVAGALGLDVDDLAGGCILDDFDNDGFTDIVASASGLKGQLRYFRNDANGRFTERTVEAGLAGLTDGLNIQQTDYNNDGWIDIWVLRGAWWGKPGRMPNSLLRNNADGTFTDVTEEAGLLSFHPTQASVWFDYNGDGWLDVFIGNETDDPKDPDMCELYRNNGDGTFTECALESGLGIQRFVKGVAAGDYDHDGRPDLYVSCRSRGMNLLFHNDGPAEPGSTNRTRWRFTAVTKTVGVLDTNLVSFPTWFFDYNNDGWEDLFVSGYAIDDVGDVAADYLGLPHKAALPRLFRNNGNGSFSNVTEEAHLNKLCLTMGSNFGDLDNDGWLDFYLATGNPEFTTLVPNRMFRNAGGKFFQEVTTAGGFGHLQKGHGVGFADLDHDGDQDVYTVMGGAFTADNYRNALFLNPGTTNRWLKLKLEGVRSNRAAIGARIKVTIKTPAGTRHLYKTVNSGGSFGSSPFRQEFGLADATSIEGVEITWPTSGLQQRLAGFQLDSAYFIREGATNAITTPLKRLQFDLKAKSDHAKPLHGASPSGTGE